MEKKTMSKKVRYGVVGLGSMAQQAVLPAFKNASINSELTTLFSADKQKLVMLSKKYKVKNTYHYEEMELCFQKNEIDALYIAAPNDHNREIVELASKYKINVLCEKPMAATSSDCFHMDQIAKKSGIKLMVAYGLQFEAANLDALKICRSGQLGEVNFFNSTFSYQMKNRKNMRIHPPSVGGGALYAIGIYCINAARYLFKDEPIEVVAFSATSDDPRYINTEEITSAILRFPNGKLAAFTVSFGAFDSSDYEIIGTKGRILIENAYDYATPMELRTFIKSHNEMKHSKQKYKKRDDFSAELLYFSDCIQKDRVLGPNAMEAIADVKIIEAILTSIHKKSPVSLTPIQKSKDSDLKQKITRPGVRKRKPQHVLSSNKSHNKN